MKRLLFYYVAAVMTLTVTSCEDDEIARTLDGIWEGEVATEYFTYRNYTADYQYVDIHFYTDPSHYASGTGVEYDYQSNHYYTKCEFTFSVKSGRIYLNYEDGTRVVIRNYTLKDNRFSGDFIDYDTGEYLATFNFYKVSDWRYDRYSYDREYYYAPNGSLEYRDLKKK